MATTETVVSWSGGKDGASALWRLRGEGPVDVVGLLTTVSMPYDRVGHHGVRRGLIEHQAAAIGLPVTVVELPINASDDAYERAMAGALDDLERRGVGAIAFGDVHLDDVRGYRERNLAGRDIGGSWPVWGADPAGLAREFVEAGFEATVVAVDAGALDPSFLGRRLDRGFLDDLPADVDPGGENGEYHTFVTDGPVFAAPVAVEVGEVVERDLGSTTMAYLDLVAT